VNHESVATVETPSPATSSRVKGRLFGLLAEYENPTVLKSACEKLRDAGFTRFDAHSPFPVHGIDDCIGIRPTKLPIIVFVAGVLGCATGIGLQWWANAMNAEAYQPVGTWWQAFLGYNFLVSGKPYWSFPANIPIIFELTVLFAALAATFGMFAMNNLPWFHNPLFNSRRFAAATDDRFFISVDARDAHFREADVSRLLESAGAVAVERVEETPCAARPPWNTRLIATIAISVAVIPLAVVALSRNSKSSSPRIHIIQDMDNQERFKSQQANPLFADGRAMRQPVGASAAAPLGTTVARGELVADAHFEAGYVDGRFVTGFPLHRPEIEATEAFVRRGQERFNIYCAACHGRDGSGNGMVNKRGVELGGGWVPASDLRDAERRGRPVGHIFNTVTNGIRTMPAYGDAISPADRWAIVAYVRALQRAYDADSPVGTGAPPPVSP